MIPMVRIGQDLPGPTSYLAHLDPSLPYPFLRSEVSTRKDAATKDDRIQL